MTTVMTFTGTASAVALTLLASTALAQGTPKVDDVKAADSPADSPACPPGAFCEETTVAPPEDPTEEAPPTDTPPYLSPVTGDDGTTVVLPPPNDGSDPEAPRTFTYHPDPNGGPGQIIVYEPGAAPPSVVGNDMEAPAPPPRPKRKKRWRRHRRWGFNMRVDGLMMPRYREDVSNTAGMAGLGLSILYRPTPMFALDIATDFIGGTDAMGYERQEFPISVSARVYANPRNMVQFYLFGGMNWSFARVTSETVQPHLAEGTSDSYTYFGGHGGLGLEFRVSKLIGINLDGLAFVRTRTDADDYGAFPEYYNASTGETSNSAVAGMMRGGVTFWW
jgi:hypothetical protein